jgi:hypothetical protein
MRSMGFNPTTEAHANAGTNDQPTTHHPHVSRSENRHTTIPSFLKIAPRVCRHFAITKKQLQISPNATI